GGLVKQHKAFGSRLINEEFDREWFASLSINQFGVLDFVAGFPKQFQCLAEVVAYGVGITTDRIGIRRCKQFVRHLVADGLEYFQFFSGRHAGSGEFGGLGVAGDPLVLAEKKLTIHFLENEGEVKGANA